MAGTGHLKRLGLLLAAVAGLLGLILPGPVCRAQSEHGLAGDLRIQQLRIQVMPEFDDPRVLVIVQGRFTAAENQFPAPVTFRLPLEAQINQMATIETMAGGTTAEAFDTRPDPDDGQWLLATYTLRDAHFFYEYYYDPLPADADKDFTFLASSLYPVDDLLIEVQEPAAASDLRLEPAAAASRLDPALNLRYHQIRVGPLPAGGETAVRVRYTKTDPAPSLSWEDVMATQAKRTDNAAPALQVMASDAMASEAMASQAMASQATAPEGRVPVGILAGLGLSALAAAIIIGWVRARPGSPATPLPGGSVRFCPDCGTALRPEARYCHACGAEARLAAGEVACAP
jgi:hypothetical protein